MRKLPESLRKEANQITTFYETGFELDLSETAELNSEPTQTSYIYKEISEDNQNLLEQKF